MAVTAMVRIIEMCEQILAEHRRILWDIENLLLPGVGEEEIATATSEIGVRLPTAATAMYVWRNGTILGKATFGEMAFYPGWYFMALDEALGVYRDLEKYPEVWDATCFPMFSSGGGDFMGIVCDKDRASDARIISYREGLETRIEFSTLEAMLKTIIESFRAGVFFRDRDRFKVNRAKFREIAGRLNPDLERWK